MIYTIGHSTLNKEDFIDLVKHHLDVVIDIRSHPTSRWEQFRKENLEEWLPEAGIKYEWEPRLGGWTEDHMLLANMYLEFDVDIAAYSKGKFPKQRIGKDKEGIKMPSKEEAKENPSWYNQGLWDYQWFMTLIEFQDGVNELIERGKSENIGIMCCEVLWWKCHRSMVSDYLAFHGIESVHLQPKLTNHSKVLSNRLDRYHRKVKEAWECTKV